MPQMAPLMWLILFFIFILIFLLFNILNYFNYLLMNSNKSENEKPVKKLILNWKW